ncbi:hypothetical protein MMC14_008224 [Varicellaria rhodocarpa]|nr:hypothetical protein [Varicellaria rhodocarpa]
MCNDDGSSPAGHAIAVLHHSMSPPDQALGGIGLPWKILFSNYIGPNYEPTTKLQCQNLTVVSSPHTHYELQIHHQGDISDVLDECDTMLFRFPVQPGNGEWQILDQRLDLGVGGAGVIGRGVTVWREGREVGRGVLGWGNQ